jgi:Mn2+/Fe2+ NRAMP family transporter
MKTIDHFDSEQPEITRTWWQDRVAKHPGYFSDQVYGPASDRRQALRWKFLRVLLSVFVAALILPFAVLVIGLSGAYIATGPADNAPPQTHQSSP